MTDEQIKSLIQQELQKKFNENQVYFDTAIGHNHDGRNSRFIENILLSNNLQGNRGQDKLFGSIINVYHGTVATAGAAGVNVQWTFTKKFTNNGAYIIIGNVWDNNNGSSTSGNPNFYATEGNVNGNYAFLCARNLSALATLVVFQAIAIGY